MNPLIALFFSILLIGICTKGINDSKTYVLQDAWAFRMLFIVSLYLLFEVTPFVDRWNYSLFGVCMYSLCETLFGVGTLILLPYLLCNYRTFTTKTIDSKK